ncbi:unnamed protein product [Cladocopium goreaui]|uniref:RNase H type-1 domain-containing protein n=1 Tax=Cladocopium goreaui TaxID=2562237 RepID=A0A9P1C1Y2_9DINO|nr:unnamed protein product [Cladocopium goreaui]
MPPLPPPTTPWTGYNMQNMPGMHFPQQMPHMQPATPQAMAAAPPAQGPQQPLAPLAPVLHPSMPPQISVETAQKEFIEMAKARQMELPPDMRQRVQRMSKSEGAQATKELHTAVRTLGFARKDVEEALQARCNLITSWKHFLADAVQQWQGYTTLFQQQEQELQARIQQAHAVFATAKEQAEQSQAEAGKISTIEIVDDEEELKGEQASVEKTSGQIQEGLTHLTASLQQLQASAEAIETMEKAAKRPRTSENAANDEAMEAKGDFTSDGAKHWDSSTPAIIMKWNNRAVCNEAFVSEWQAIESALRLSREFLMPLSIATTWSNSASSQCRDAAFHQLEHPTTKTSRRSSLRVGFAEDLELWIGIEDSMKMYKLNVPIEVGATRTTPWSCPNTPFSEDAHRDQRFVAHSSSDGHINIQRLSSRPTWASGIEAILNEEGQVDESEEDMVVYLTSYFISHRDLHRHAEPRILRFDREVEEWEREVRFMWEDLVDHDAAIDVVIVRPDPPREQANVMSKLDTMSSQKHKRLRSSTEDIRRTVIFTLDGRAFPASLSWNDLEDQHATVARLGGFHEGHIAQLWQVTHRPHDLIRLNLQCKIVQLRTEPRPTSFMKIILIDIDIYSTQSLQPFAMRRQARWMPRVINRRSVFRLLSLDEQFQEQEEHCYLWHNHDAIAASQTEPLRLEDGDYIQIHIGEKISSLSCDSASREASNGTGNESWNPPDAQDEDEHIELFQRSIAQLPKVWQTLQQQLQQTQLKVAPEHVRRFGLELIPRLGLTISWSHGKRISTLRWMWSYIWYSRNPLVPIWSAFWPIIEQSHRREHTIGLISIVRQGHRQMRIRHAAYSLPELLSRNYVLRISEVYQECQSHPLHCRVQQGMIPFGLFDIEEIPRAVGIVVELPNVAEPQPIPDDGTELMQRTTTRWQRRAQPQQESSDASSTGGSCEGFSFNPNAPSFVPQPDLNSVPEAIEELHQHWQQTAYAWEGESASTMVMTWFVDQFHPGYRVCLQPRPVRLFEDFTQWEVQLRNVWRDRSLQGAPIMIHVVEPPPPQVHPDIATHVLLVQNPQDTMSTIVLTGVDSTTARSLLFTQMAVTMQENFVLDQLLMLIGLGHQCLSPGTQYFCMAWYGNTAIPIGTPFPIRDGYGIILRVGFRPVQPVPADANALLQTALRGEKRHENSAERRSGTCERLTAATVAHEQRPQEATEGIHRNVHALPPVQENKKKERTDWPTQQQPQRNHRPIFDGSQVEDRVPSTMLAVGITIPELQQFFNPANHPLHRDLSGFEIPEICQQLIEDCVMHQRIDRLLIYADGSSQSKYKRKPPLWIEEHDISDSWCFAVFGENYDSDKLMFIGFQCQQVLYNEAAPHHLGTAHIGADAAECEAMCWAALWRLAQNHRIPTVFLTDSQLTRGQANGDTGASTTSIPFCTLRGLFQALQAVLPGDQLKIQHVMGHAGDAGNEFVDFFAKIEAIHSLHLPRQTFDSGRWLKVIPYLWMLLHQAADLPPLTTQGFDISAPELPALDGQLLQPAKSKQAPPARLQQVSLSLCSANVRSLYTKPHGHAGKLDFLRGQMKQLKLNVVGIQEARSHAGQSAAEQVLRISGGDQQGQLGVELWVNLTQPYAYQGRTPVFFQRMDFVVVEATPRTLLVLHDHPSHRFWFLVAHGPQSGRPQEEREEWWMHLTTLLFQHVQSDKIFILIDANAATGPRDDIHIFQHDDRTSVNTKYFTEFLREMDMAVPSTGARHEGPHHTWTSPIDAEQYRLDYVLLRTDMVGDCVHSQTVPEFDLGNYGDHIAVAIQVQWNAACSQLSRHHCQSERGPGVQRSSITYQKMHDALTDYQPLPWAQDIETQVNHMNQFVHSRLRKHCSRQEAAPKKQCLSGEVWTLRSQRIRTKKTLVEVQQRLRAELLFKALSSWRNHAETPDADIASYMTTLLCGKLRIVACLHRLDRTLRHALQQAKGRALDEQLRQMPHDAAASTVLHEIKQIIGTTNFKKKKSTPLPLINRTDGTPCRSIQEVQDRWIHFFQFMECGERLDVHALRQKWIANLSTFRRSDVHLCLQDLPSLTDLEQAFRNVKANKATGDDGIPSEICHACPAAMARITYTQLMKLCAHGQEADYYEGFMQQQQVGGRRKVPVQLGTHMVRALRLPPSAMTELARLLDLPGATEQAGLPQHLRLAMCAIHTDTHFHVEGQTDRVRTQAGSRPGDPFADVVFGYLFSRILGVVEQRLIQEQLLDQIPEYKSGISLVREPEQAAPERPMLGPTWMDDLAICISGPSAIDLERKAALTAGILLETCMEHGVTPNLTRGKTELLLALRGKGSRNSRRAHFSERQGRQMQIVHEHGTDSIAVVGSYVHLGGKAHHSGENKVEARRRVSIANEAFNHHRRQLFQNSQISLQRRRELFDTLVMSKLCFGMESWTFRDQQLVNYIHGAIIRLDKRLIKVPANHHMDDYEVLATCRLPSPKTLFRRARLRYLLTLFNCEEAVPWGLFQQDQTWCNMLKDDLHWMWQQLSNTCTLRNPADHPEEWFYITRFHKKYWKTLVHRATTLDIMKNSDNWQLRQIHFHVFDHLQSVGELNSPPPRPEVTPAKGMYGCIACGKKCRTLAGEAAHMFRCHGKVAEFRRFSDTTSCPACLREYHTVDRLHAHLRHGRRCQAQLRGMKMHRPITPGIGSQHNTVLKQRHDGLLPYQPAAGPPPRPMPLIDAQHHDLEAYEKIALECFEQGCHGRDHLRGQLFAIVQGLEISWTSLTRTVEQLIHDFTDENCELAQLPKSDIHHLLGSLRDPTHWPFVTNNAGDPEPGHRVEPLETYEVWSERLAQDFSQQPWRPDQEQPHRPFAERIILHAYSGRRRHGDVQWFLEECAAQHPDVIMHVISLDIVINSHYGDIGREEVRARWYTGMRQGYVAGFLSGPPCCTWSKELASIWRLPLLQLLSRLPGMQHLNMAQGLLGRSIGTDETGVYRTAELKEYPPAMCAAMAHAFTDATLTAIHAVPEQHVEHVPQDFLDLCQTMVSHDFGVEYGPDCVQ